MSTKKSISVFIIVLFVVFVVGLLARIPKADKSTSSTQLSAILSVNQIVYLSQDNLASSSAKVKQGTTALALLQDQIDTTTQGSGDQAFVTKIGSISADPKKKEYWSFMVNNKEAAVGAGSYLLQNGDSIVWSLKNY